MAFVEPDGDIVLIQCDLDPTYENTYRWAADNTLDEQAFWLLESPRFNRLWLHDYSYIRKLRNVIKVELGIGTVREYNYLAYRNSGFSDKWVYAFITNVEYINNNTTEIHFDLDVLQTYYTDIQFNDCVIERQHNKTDDIGDNIIDEELETGEYVVTASSRKDFTPVVVVAYTEEWDATNNKFTPVNGHLDGGINDASYYTACKYEVFKVTLTQSEVTRLNTFIEKYTEKNKINAILSIFIAPGEIFDLTPEGWTSIQENIKINNQYNIDGYTDIKNKKLLIYPFNFLQVSNYNGNAVDYRYEFFTDAENILLRVFGNTSTNPSLMIYPTNYKGMFTNWEEIVTNSCFPQCCYINDTYKAWLAQNKGMLAASAVGIGASIGMGVANIASGSRLVGTATALSNGGLMSGANAGREIGYGVGQQKSGLSQLAGGLAGAAALLGKMYDHSTLPPTAHGNGNGDLMYQADLGGFGIYHKTITAEYARRIDGFFQMFGYKQNIVGKPDLFARQGWVYIKTAGASIHGKIPADDARTIEAIYNKGIRYWNIAVTFGDYSQVNQIYSTGGV